MAKLYRNPYLLIPALGLVAYIIHFLVLKYVLVNACNGELFLERSYLFFAAASLVIAFLLGRIRKSNIDYVGYGFLFLTCTKMAAAYVFFKAAFGDLGSRGSCKISFFFVFIIFLMLETLVAIRILNSKSQG